MQYNTKFVVVYRDKFSPSFLKYLDVEKNSKKGYITRWGTKWFGGIISNFERVRWFYFYNKKPLFNEVPDILVVLNRIYATSIIDEAFSVKLPIILYSCYDWEDEEAAYLFYGATHNSPKQINTFFFFSLLRHIFFLEHFLKK